MTTFDVLLKLRKSIWPFCSKSRIFVDEDIVDLFGPLWVMLTLIVEIAIVSFIVYQIDIATMALEFKNGNFIVKNLSYSMMKVAQNAFVIIAYFILNPLMMMLLIKYILWVPQV